MYHCILLTPPHLLENLDDSFEKKLALFAFSAEVSCEDMGIPPNCPVGGRGRVLVCPEWKVDRSGTLRAKEAASAPAAGTGRPIPRPGGDRGSLLKEGITFNLTLAELLHINKIRHSLIMINKE